MTKEEEIRMINEKLDFYVMEASDEEFDTEEVRKLVKRLDELDPIPLPNIRNIVSTVTQSHLYVGQTESISVLVEPNNCFDSSYEWKSSDKSVAIVDKLDDGQTVIRATGIGNCTLTCIAKEGGCSTTCNVLVESTFKKRENAHGMLSLTAMLAVACIFCAALSPVLCVPVAIATVVCGVLAIARNKGDRFWAFILMAVAVLTALEVTGITNWL